MNRMEPVLFWQHQEQEGMVGIEKHRHRLGEYHRIDPNSNSGDSRNFDAAFIHLHDRRVPDEIDLKFRTAAGRHGAEIGARGESIGHAQALQLSGQYPNGPRARAELRQIHGHQLGTQALHPGLDAGRGQSGFQRGKAGTHWEGSRTNMGKSRTPVERSSSTCAPWFSV